MLNIGVVLLDPEAHGIHIPFAKSQLRALAKDWVGLYMCRILELDGALVKMEMIDAQNGRVTITPIKPYLETGFFDNLSVWPGEQLFYFPSVIRFSPRVAALSAADAPRNGPIGRRLKDGDETWTQAGCKPKDKLKEIIAAVPNETVFARNEPSFCEPLAIYERKALVGTCPPSLYTGKLRLYVQCLYGSARKNLKLNAEGQLSVGTGKFVDPEPILGPEEIRVDLKHGYGTTGLVSIGHGEYLMLEITPVAIFSRKMTPTKRLKVRATPEEEAVHLSTLTPSATVKLVPGNIKDIGLDGYPLAYGWHFSDTGTEAAVCLAKDAPINGQSLSGSRGSATVGGYAFTQYIVKFSYDVKARTLTYIASAGQTRLHIPYLNQNIWFPADPTDGPRMRLLTPSSRPPWDCFADLPEAPVYCFYRGDDLRTVTMNCAAYSLSEAKNTVVPNEENNPALVFKDPYTVNASTALMENLPVIATTGRYHVKIGDDEVSGNSIYAPGHSYTTEYNMSRDGIVSNFDALTNTGTVKNGTYYAFSAPGSTRIVKDTVNKQLITKNVLVIPFDDASAALIGRQNKHYYDYTITTRQTFGQVAVYWKSTFDPASFVNTARIIEPIEWNGPGGGSLSFGPSVNVYVDPLKTCTSVLYLLSAAGKETIVTYSASGENAANVEFSDRPHVGLFDPAAAAYPYYDVRMSVRSSHFGAARHDNCVDRLAIVQTGYLGGWPKDVDTPVGWA